MKEPRKRRPLKAHAAPAATLVLFGAAGDLVKRLLMPALTNLSRDGMIANGLSIIGVDHNPRSDEDYRAQLGDFLKEIATNRGAEGGGEPFDAAKWAAFAASISYLEGDFTDDGAYAALKEKLAAQPSANAIFYLATAPRFFAEIIERLGKAGLVAEENGTFRRVVIEKPFGSDLPSAQALNQRILKVLDESQIYRIDHFLGKETVQNILVSRFANAVLEATWNNRYVDHVQITASETVGVEKRGAFYEATGALRDMVPNHLFQLMSMVAMEPPNAFDAKSVRDEKAKVIGAIRPWSKREALKNGVRGQYDAGKIGKKAVPAYRDEPDVAKRSKTETYVALKLMVDNWRWGGVPFYLRTGKRMTSRDTEIAVCFKPAPMTLFRDSAAVPHVPPNYLVIQIQPDEGISFQFQAKRPGQEISLTDVSMSFAYKDFFKLEPSTGYETLLYDCLIGDQTLFQSADNIEVGWRAVQAFLDAWADDKAVASYEAGSAGPEEADDLLARDGRAWRTIG